VDLSVSDLNLAHILDDSLNLFASQAQAKNLALHYQIEQNTPLILQADANRLRQALISLVDNAVKFTNQGQVLIQAAARPGSRLRFAVKDSGVGIAPEKQALIFQPFAQADSSTTRKYGGAGLGLSVFKHLVELMEGESGLESRPGDGSVFWFEIPFRPPNTRLESGTALTGKERLPLTAAAAIVKSARPAADNAPTDPPRLLPAPQTAARILLVDDTKVNQMVARGILQKMGYMVTVADNGRMALDALRQHDYDLILMDCQMPEMDGYEATRAIRSGQVSQHKSQIPIVALTANAVAEDQEKGMAAGMNDYLLKPIVPDLLAQVLNKWLGKNP
jgi:CheY-like chemotaxis protein/anti-sigma regulatory factor (Ser/Thr protein kinase)